MLQEVLPELYRPLFSKPLLQAEVPEKLATCENCLRSRVPRLGVSYKSHLKCCTYHPFQPNFLLGGALGSEQAGRRAVESVERKVREREFALPIGIVAPVYHQVEFNARTKTEFGNREDWLCPYFDLENQNCGIWRHRGAVCSTFYCESQYGEAGAQFWEQLSDYLTYVEMALMEEALVMLDFSPRQISENLEYLNRFDATPTELQERVLAESKARKIWNGYFEDQLGFYKKCYEIVANMTKKQFQEAMGDQGKMIERDLMRGLQEVLRLKLG